ncbi:aminoacyl-tRNA hydrolase [Polymorphobacter multimanifer]|uniref:Ribosome-associated protein n=1 Tax=Polymorphobacter multimanifer TaxID=1070431 RepID=A0A841L553_9SPHN|nr:alternative ribosome rescue aminoacyl-tRNA hydrolase ArfB [Polymorphobacter multimanifer]MBB6227757.1 ribosome-associated protein [Polymorphobacter multimanifer]GGI76759.1 aminoacyl-tRNA hydrolase [Polymorphobacter multimanifer]
MGIVIPEDELQEAFIRASGPGGQNVNKVNTAVQLRFDVRHSPSLPDDVAVRLMRLAGSRMTRDGVLVIEASRFRTQERNRADARLRLAALVAAAEVRPVKRRPTKPTRASGERRLAGKAVRSGVKSGRGRVRSDD